DEMARGQTDFNTRIVISPFPEEAATQSGNDYWRRIGYVPHLTRGFVQLYHMNGNELISGSLSFDGSNKKRLIEVFGQLGIEIPEDEITDNWLKYAITGNFTEEQAKGIATTIADMAGNSAYKKNTNTVDVTKQFGAVMERVFNESYIHICESLARGRQTEGVRGLVNQLAANAHNFNDRYATALNNMKANIDQFSDDDSIVLHELLVYSTIEMMRALHLNEMTLLSNNTISGQRIVQISPDFLYAADASSFQNMLGGFGAKGAKSNRVYSACGLEVSLGDDGNNSDENGNPQSAYGGVDGGAEESSGKKSMTCPFCGAKVWGDPCAAVLSCWDCKAYTKNGRVRYKGDGGHKIRDERAAAKETERRKRRSVKIAAAAERADRRSEAEAKVEDAFRESGLSF
ncbi:MAG TPA: hypothetical protein VLG47_02555, partial [Candidatus Saccharimonadales bacterium]|nr:hypothetical protein [Candidatus Saccharimonadales bacterium]